jgi:hypothetical protein
MKKQTRSILEELESMHHARDSRYVIEARAENLIAAAINLIDLMEHTYTESEVDDLTRKLLNSIKQKDSLKFKRSLGRINESKNESK